MTNQTSGSLYGWGAGHTGALGSGPQADSPAPQPVPGLPPVHTVAAGGSSAYAIDGSGQVWSWGWDEFSHMLGRGRVEYPLPMAPTSLRNMGYLMTDRIEGDGGVGYPAIVEGLPPIEQLAIAESNVYALADNGEVWVWGDRQGLGKRIDKPADTPQRIDVLKNIQQISASPTATTIYALDNKQRIWSWGNGYEGQLGHGELRFDAEPKMIPTLSEVKSIHAGALSAWALSDDGSVWFWGDGELIGLNAGNRFRIKEPIQLMELADIKTLFVGPYSCIARSHSGESMVLGSFEELLGIDAVSEVAGRVTYIADIDFLHNFSLAGEHGLATDDKNRLHSFGHAAQGALGNGTMREQEYHPPAPISGMHDVCAFAAGCGFSLAIIGGQ